MNKWGAEGKPFITIIDFDTKNIKVKALDKLPKSILFEINNKTNRERQQIDINILKSDRAEYYKSFDKVSTEISYGNTFLINLTTRTDINCDASLREIYNNSVAKYKLYYKDKFVVFSPETFVKIRKEESVGKIYSYPMKGTIDATIPGAKEKILEDPKEKAEHYTIVDLIRNDLSMVAKKVTVTKFRYLDLINSPQQKLYQVSSEITGELGEDYSSRLGDIIMKILPAGSISGAPKKKTIEIIKKSEVYKRGFYTGICGVFDGVNFDSFVMIRFIKKKGEKYFYHSGGGITFMSERDKEYDEMIQKIYVPTSE